MERSGVRPSNRLSVPMWGGAALLLALPAVAMRFTKEVNWTLSDFVVFGAMLLVACGSYELAARTSGSRAYRAAAGVAVGAAFFLVWVNLAVGIFGNEGNRANLLFFAVLLMGIAGAVVARFRAEGMARALRVMAVAQGLVAVIGLCAGWFRGALLTAFFVGIWLLSAHLFRKAAREQPPLGAAS